MLAISSSSVLSLNLNFPGGKKAPAAKPAFAYGLPGNFNALGGAELNFDPAGFLEGKSEVRECWSCLRPSHTRSPERGLRFPSFADCSVAPEISEPREKFCSQLRKPLTASTPRT